MADPSKNNAFDLDFVLDPGESLLWERSTGPGKGVWGGTVGVGAWFILMFIISLQYEVIRDRQGKLIPNAHHLMGFMAIVGVLSVLMAAIAAIPRTSRYLLTDKRAIVIRPRVLRSRRVDSFPLDGMQFREEKDGRADVIFRIWPSKRGFFDLEIEEARRVASIVTMSLTK